MNFDEYLAKIGNTLVGYYMLASASNADDVLEMPYPPSLLSEEQVTCLKDNLRECMPLNSMIIDLWNCDVHFEEELEDDWYFEAVFGSASAIEPCAETLAAFFVDQCEQLDLDYDQYNDPEWFADFVLGEATKFLTDWRRNLWMRYGPRETREKELVERV